MKIKERIYNVVTGEITDVERDATAQEVAEYEKTQAEITESAVKEAEVAAAKAALLERLGITEEEAKLLLS